MIIMGAFFYLSSRQVQKAVAQNQEQRGINELMTARVIDHLKWMDGISTGMFIQNKEFTGKLDPEECNLGKRTKKFKPYQPNWKSRSLPSMHRTESCTARQKRSSLHIRQETGTGPLRSLWPRPCLRSTMFRHISYK